MPYSELFIFLLEIVGTIAFASSGAMLGIRRSEEHTSELQSPA